MEFFDCISVVVFWAAIILAVTSVFTAKAAFITRTHDRMHGMVSWLSLAIVAGSVNWMFATTNTLF